MPNKLEQLESELKHLHSSMDDITEAFNQGRLDENNDTVLPESAAIKIQLLLEN